MTILAAVRDGSVNIALFVHVLGAMLLVGTLGAAGVATIFAWRRPERAVGLTRFALKTIPWGVLPAYILMRVGAQWTEAKENFPDDFDPAWLGIGYVTAEAGAVLVLVSLILAGIGLRKLRGGGSGVALGRAAGILCLILLAAYVVAVWAMTAKPG